MRTPSFLIYGALVLVWSGGTTGAGAGPGATVLQQVPAPDLSRRRDTFTPDTTNSFLVTADLRPAASVIRPDDQRRPPLRLSPSAAPPPPPPAPQQPSEPHSRPQTAPTAPSRAPQATRQPLPDQSTVEIREINPPFVQQINTDGSPFRPPPPPPPPPAAEQHQQQFRRPPPQFRRPRPPFRGRRPPARPAGRPGRPIGQQRLGPNGHQRALQQLQQRFFGRPPARAALHRRFRRDVSAEDLTGDVTGGVPADVKQDRRGTWQMEYAMRKAADPASMLNDSGDVPPWAPLKPEARARLARSRAESLTGSADPAVPSEQDEKPIKVTEVFADNAEEARIALSAGDEVYILRVPEDVLDSTSFIDSPAQRLRWRDGRARADRLEPPSEPGTARAEQPWWSRIPLLGRFIYGTKSSENSPVTTVTDGAASATPAQRSGYDSDVLVVPDYDPYLSVDGNGRPYYRTPGLAEQANYENIPDQIKPVLNPTDEFVLPDNLEDPFRGGYTPVRPGYQYVPYVPYLPSPYYPPGDAKYHRRQQLFPTQIDFPSIIHRQREDDSANTKAASREAGETQAAEISAPGVDEAQLERAIVRAAKDRVDEVSVIDTGDHYAVISGDINKFIDFDAAEISANEELPKARHSLADLLQRSKESASDEANVVHSRTKRQAGLYPVRAPLRRRPLRRPIRRRDDVGRYPPPPPPPGSPHVSAFRPPWESGRRTPRPGRPAPPQRPNGRQPAVVRPVFEPSAARPVFEQAETRPVFEQAETRPVFEQAETRPVFEQAETRPVFEQTETRPVFEQTDRRPLFDQVESRPVFEEAETRPAFEHSVVRPTFEQPVEIQQAFQSPVRQPSHSVIAAPQAQFGGFLPVTRPVVGTPPPAAADLLLSDAPTLPGDEADGGARQPEAPFQRTAVRLDTLQRTVVTTVPSRSQPRPQQTAGPAPPPPADQRLTAPQQELAGSQRYQQIVRVQEKQPAAVRPGALQDSQPAAADNLIAGDGASSGGGSWASAALAGLSAILGGSSSAATESAAALDNAPAAAVSTSDTTRPSGPLTVAENTANRHSGGAQNGENSRNAERAEAPTQSVPRQPSHKSGTTSANGAKPTESGLRNKHDTPGKEKVKSEPVVTKVVKRHRKRQRRPVSSSAAVSRTASLRNSSRRSGQSAVVHRRRRPTTTPTPADESSTAASEAVSAAPAAPRRRVPFGARVRPTSGQRRRRPISRRPTTVPVTAQPVTVTQPPTQEPAAAGRTRLVGQAIPQTPPPTETGAQAAPQTPPPTEKGPQAEVEHELWMAEATDEHVEIAAPPAAGEQESNSVHQTLVTGASQPAQTPVSAVPATEAAEQPEAGSDDLSRDSGRRPQPTVPRRRLPPPTGGQSAVYRVTTPAHGQPSNGAEDTRATQHASATDQEELRGDEKQKQEEGVDDVHSQLESYLSRYAEKYGLGLVTTSSTTERSESAGRPAAPVSGLRWAHLAARARTPAPADGDDAEADAFVTGEPDGDERVSVGSQYSYRVQLPPSRRVPPSLNSVRLQPKSKLAQLLGSSPRLRPSTAKPTIPWPAGYQPFTVTSTTPRPGRWASRREKPTSTTPAPPLPTWTTGPAWSRYADEFTTTERATTTETPSLSSTRSRPIFIPPINRKRVRPRPLTLLHAGPRQPPTTTTTEQPTTTITEQPTEPPTQTETVSAPTAATENIDPASAAAPVRDAEQATPETIDDTTTAKPTVTSPEPTGRATDEEDPLVVSSEEPVGESSLFSVIYSKERPHAPRPQPEIFSRLNQFLVEHGQTPPSAPSSVSVTVGSSPIRVPFAAPAVAQDPVTDEPTIVVDLAEPPATEDDDEEDEPVPAQVVTSDGAVIVQAVPAEAAPAATHGSWVPTVQAVALAPAVVGPSRSPGTVVVYPEHMSQAQREANWPAQPTHAEEEQEQEEQEEQEESLTDSPAPENEWYPEPADESEGFHDLVLSDEDLPEEVVYIDTDLARGKTARLDDEAPSAALVEPEDEAALPLPVDEASTGSTVEVVPRPVHDPYGVFWTSPSGATNAEQAESQQLAGAFAAAAAAAAVDPTASTPADDEAAADRAVNMCLDGKCMLIYEPGRQVRVQVNN